MSGISLRTGERYGFDGDPATVSSVWDPRRFSSISEEEADELDPNLKPPDSRRPCFFENEPSRRTWEVVFAVKLLLAKPDKRGEDGPGSSDTVDR